MPANLKYIPDIDDGIRDIVSILTKGGVETFESCQGGDGHEFPCPTVRFYGQSNEGYRALSIAMENGLRVSELRRSWSVIDGELSGPFWELTFNGNS